MKPIIQKLTLFFSFMLFSSLVFSEEPNVPPCENTSTEYECEDGPEGDLEYNGEETITICLGSGGGGSGPSYTGSVGTYDEVVYCLDDEDPVEESRTPHSYTLGGVYYHPSLGSLGLGEHTVQVKAIITGGEGDCEISGDDGDVVIGSLTVKIIELKVELIGPEGASWCVDTSPMPQIIQRNSVNRGNGFLPEGDEMTLLLSVSEVGAQVRTSEPFIYEGCTAPEESFSYSVLDSSPVVVIPGEFNHPQPTTETFSGNHTIVYIGSGGAPGGIVETALLTGETSFTYSEESLITGTSLFCGAPVELQGGTTYSVGVQGGITLFGFLNITAGVDFENAVTSSGSWGGESGTQSDLDFRVPIKNFQTNVSSWGGNGPTPGNASGSFKYGVGKVKISKRCCN